MDLRCINLHTLSFRNAGRPGIAEVDITMVRARSMGVVSEIWAGVGVGGVGGVGMGWRGGEQYGTDISPPHLMTRLHPQTGRYPIRTGCMGDTTAHRVIPTPSSPGGLDPAVHMSLARVLLGGGYVGEVDPSKLSSTSTQFRSPAH